MPIFRVFKEYLVNFNVERKIVLAVVSLVVVIAVVLSWLYNIEPRMKSSDKYYYMSESELYRAAYEIAEKADKYCVKHSDCDCNSFSWACPIDPTIHNPNNCVSKNTDPAAINELNYIHDVIAERYPDFRFAGCAIMCPARCENNQCVRSCVLERLG